MKTITETQSAPPTRTPRNNTPVGRLFFLEASGGRVHSVNTDGSDRKVIVTGCRVPDGIVVDVEAGPHYRTNHGNPSRQDGPIERADAGGPDRGISSGEREACT